MHRLRYLVYIAVVVAAWLVAGRLGTPVFVPASATVPAARMPGSVSQVKIARVVKMPMGGYAVVLKTEPGAEGARWVTIMVGDSEGAAIEREHVMRLKPPRPMTHDLMGSIVSELGGRVIRVTVTRLEDNVFHGAVSVEAEGRVRHIDSRPSDSIALAVRTLSPIYVADDVIATAGTSGPPWEDGTPGEPGREGNPAGPELVPGAEII